MQDHCCSYQQLTSLNKQRQLHDLIIQLATGRYTMGNQCIKYEIITRTQWNCHSHTSAAAAAAHCVRSKEFAAVLEKTWNQEGGLEDLYKGSG